MSRAYLERRIADERMHELEPHGTPPDWLWQFDAWQPLVWTMDTAGTVASSWVRLDEVSWHEAVAIRMENPGGVEIDVAGLGDDEDWGW